MYGLNGVSSCRKSSERSWSPSYRVYGSLKAELKLRFPYRQEVVVFSQSVVILQKCDFMKAVTPNQVLVLLYLFLHFIELFKQYILFLCIDEVEVVGKKSRRREKSDDEYVPPKKDDQNDKVRTKKKGSVRSDDDVDRPRTRNAKVSVNPKG